MPQALTVPTSKRRDPSVEVPDLAGRITSALEVGRDRLDPAAVEHARTVLQRVGERAIIGAGHTVVALGGPTGSGKSSLFNALAGFDISTVGVRRPTTDTPVACVWGTGSAALLDWLGVPERHRTERISELEAGSEEPLNGLVLLDMPDHDSREAAHRTQVDRLVGMVDLLIWVVDPQKYADAVLHAEYLRRMVHHEDVVVVVLNQVDTLPTESIEVVHDDLRRILVEDGLPNVGVIVSSARTGLGVARIRSLLEDAVASKEMATARARADLVGAIARLREGVGEDEAMVEAGGTDSPLVAALADAVGVPTVLAAVEGSYRHRAARFTGWPVTRWLGRFRRDPMERWRIPGAPAAGYAVNGSTALTALDSPVFDRSSLPPPGPAGFARVDIALRSLIERAAGGLPPRWANSVRSIPASGADLWDPLDRAVAGTDLRMKDPGWWRLIAALHVLLFLSAGIGLVSLVALAAMDFLQFPEPEVPTVVGFPLPTMLLVLGLLGGPILAVLASAIVGNRARARRRAVETDLLVAVAAVAREHVVDPVAGVLTEHRHSRDLLTL